MEQRPSSSSNELREFCLALPKVDLHAHLSGSISRQTLHKIWKAQKEADHEFDLDDPLAAMGDGVFEHDDFFSLFSKFIYQLVNNVEAVRTATEETLQNFEDDGVIHFEVRTTPRAFQQTNMSKDLYISTILEAISNHNQRSKRMKTYLILSIDRRNTLEEALETASLAINYRNLGVIGVDLCGDSLCGDISIFREPFAKVKAAGLKITLHFGEEPSCVPELMTLLEYGPSRLGHLLFISEEVKKEIVSKDLGIELCLTSNIKGDHVERYEDHHLAEWLREDVPIALCTDNAGLMQSPGSNEYFLAASNFPLSYQQLFDISLKSIDATFVNDSQKDMYRQKMIEWKGGPGSKWIK